MTNIRIDPDTMNAREGEYRNEDNEVDGVITQMGRMLHQL